MDKLLNLIFLQTCFICHRFGSCLCNKCLDKFPILKSGFCVVCDQPSEQGITHEKCQIKHMPTQLLSFFSYEGQVRECILRSKFNSKEFMTLKNLCHYTFAKHATELYKLAEFTLVPIPLSKEKKLERGFNQAEVIAIILSKKTNAPINRNLLVRALNTVPQYGNDRNTRFKNVQNAFKLTHQKNGLPFPQKVLLVDDISTSGATFLEASRILLKAGVKEVRCLSISKKLFDITVPAKVLAEDSLKMPAD